MNGKRHKYAGTQTRPFSLGYGKEGAEVFTTLSFAKDWHKTIRNACDVLSKTEAGVLMSTMNCNIRTDPWWIPETTVRRQNNSCNYNDCSDRQAGMT